MTRAAVRLAWLYNGIDDKLMVNPVNDTASAWSEMRQLGVMGGGLNGMNY